MTDVAYDVTARFTPEAQARFEDYLAHTRAALAGCAELSPDDIEQDVRAHVAAEFPSGSGWVRLDQLEAVLSRLGRPEQWVSEAGRSSWRRGVDWVRTRPGFVRRHVRDAAARFRTGPDDWRLAYLTFGLLVVGVIIFPLLIVILPATYILGRAAVSLARERGTSLGPQRWLVYPPLVIVSLPLLIGLLVWPAAPAAAMADGIWRSHRADIQEVMALPRDLSEFLLFTYLIVGALSFWNLLVGVLFWVFPRLPAFLFAPFFRGDNRRPGGVLAVIGGAVFALWLSFTLRTIPVGEWASEWWKSGEEGRFAAEVARPSRGGVEEHIALSRQALEQRTKKIVTDFLRACRNQDAQRAARMCDVPFYTGSAAGGLLLADNQPIIREAPRLESFFDGQLRQVRRTDQLPSEAIRVVSYEGFKQLEIEAEPVLVAVLDEILTPTDFVVGVGRQEKETGRVFVRLRAGLIKVVGMTK